MPQKNAGQYGGAAMEYIIVTVFAVTLSLAAMAIIADVVEQHLDKLAEATGIERDESPWFDP